MIKDGPSLEQWRTLYELAQQVNALAPWEYMEEVDLIGVKDPKTGQYGFISVMGMAGEYEAIAVYRGIEGYHGFWRIAGGYAYQGDMLEVMFVPQVQLSYQDHSELDKEDRGIIKRLKMKFKGSGAWPAFRRYDPAMMPWFITPEDADFMGVMLNQLLETAPRFEEDEGLLDPEDGESQFVRVYTDESGWQDEFILIPDEPKTVYDVRIDDTIIKRGKALKLTKFLLEMDVFPLPTPISSDKERGYFPYVLAAAPLDDVEIVPPMIPLEPLPSIDAMWLGLPEHVLALFEQLEGIPKGIQVVSSELHQILKPLSDTLGFKLELKPYFEVLESARHMLFGALMGGLPDLDDFEFPDDVDFTGFPSLPDFD